MVSKEKLLTLVSKQNPGLEIIGIRGLVKTKEAEWSFRFTFREKDDDFLSISEIVKYDSIKRKLIVDKKEKQISKNKNKVKNGK
jgi:hypothetical protein